MTINSLHAIERSFPPHFDQASRPLPIIFLRQHDRSGSRILDPVSKGSNDFGVSVVEIK